MGTKVTIKHEFGTFSVAVEEEGLALHHLLEDVVIPVLRGAGFSENAIANHIDTSRDGFPWRN